MIVYFCNGNLIDKYGRREGRKGKLNWVNIIEAIVVDKICG